VNRREDANRGHYANEKAIPKVPAHQQKHAEQQKRTDHDHDAPDRLAALGVRLGSGRSQPVEHDGNVYAEEDSRDCSLDVN